MRTLRVLVVLCSAVRVGAADPEPDAPPLAVAPTAASVLFDEGRALVDANQPGPACDKFAASLKLEPEALGTILNLGLCNEQQDKVATALRWFRRVQARASELHKEDTELAAKDKTSTLSALVPTLKIAFSSPAPPSTSVAIDGAKIDEIDYARIEVDAGTHEITGTQPGQPTTHDTVTIADHDARTVTIAITPPPPPPPPPPPSPPSPTIAIDRGPHQRRLAYIAGGVGAGLLIGDTVLALVAKKEFDDTDVLASRDRWKNTARYGATSLFVLGGAAIATAIYLYVKAPQQERVEHAAVTPVLDAHQLGLAVSGGF